MKLKMGLRKLLLTEHDQIYLEALVLVICARLAILICFRRIAPWALAIEPADGTPPRPVMQQQVQMALESVGRWLPWEALCLPSALAGKAILARRGFSSTVHLGVNHKGDGALLAHAWLESAGTILVGGANTDIVEAFSRKRG